MRVEEEEEKIMEHAASTGETVMKPIRVDTEYVLTLK